MKHLDEAQSLIDLFKSIGIDLKIERFNTFQPNKMEILSVIRNSNANKDIISIRRSLNGITTTFSIGDTIVCNNLTYHYKGVVQTILGFSLNSRNKYVIHTDKTNKNGLSIENDLKIVSQSFNGVEKMKKKRIHGVEAQTPQVNLLNNYIYSSTGKSGLSKNLTSKPFKVILTTKDDFEFIQYEDKEYNYDGPLFYIEDFKIISILSCNWWCQHKRNENTIWFKNVKEAEKWVFNNKPIELSLNEIYNGIESLNLCGEQLNDTIKEYISKVLKNTKK